MLTGDLVRASVGRTTVVPRFVDPDDPDLVALARALVGLFSAHVGGARGELRAALRAHETGSSGVEPGAGRVRLERGLAKLLEDRSTFERATGLDPEATRALVFERAARARAQGTFDRGRVLEEAAVEVGATAPDVDRALEADRKMHERLLAFESLEPRTLLVRYNVALAQAVLLRATAVRLSVEVRPARVRLLLRAFKFRGLLFQATRTRRGLAIELDGPLSLFGPSTKYGLALAEVLPAVLLCERFEVEAELAWGRVRATKLFRLSERDLATKDGRWRLRSHLPDPGAAPPRELEAFARRFETIAPGWKATTDVPVLFAGEKGEKRALVPDLRFAHEASGREGWLELVERGRRESVARRLESLVRGEPPGLIVALAKNLADSLGAADLPRAVIVFRSLPDAREVLAKLEESAVTSGASVG
jgi:predicted nuclease of restriction endonuclease-like RecB superfamily